MVRCHQVGGEQCSPCWENMSGANLYQIFDQLRACGCGIKRLHTCFFGRIEHCLENSQPKEQHGFRSGRRLEEHLITANLVGDKFFAANKPLWIASLDLSKTFDRVNWDAPWRRHGFCYQGRCATRMCALLPTYFAPYCHGLWRSEWMKPVNQWRIGPGSPFKAQAFAQLESNIARLSSGRWRNKNQSGVHGPKGTDAWKLPSKTAPTRPCASKKVWKNKITDGGWISMMDIHFTWSSVCWWHPDFQWNNSRGHIVPRCFDYNAGQDRLKIQCFENSHLTNRGTATRPHHDASYRMRTKTGQQQPEFVGKPGPG